MQCNEIETTDEKHRKQLVKSRRLLDDPHNLKLKVINLAIKSRNCGKIKKYTMLVKCF